MDGDLRAAMTSGVFVEFCDAHGHTVGQAVYADWRNRPVPARGDTVCCAVVSPSTGRRRKLLGRVVHRQFEIQHEPDGQPSVWVRLLLETVAPPTDHRPRSRQRIRFSAN